MTMAKSGKKEQRLYQTKLLLLHGNTLAGENLRHHTRRGDAVDVRSVVVGISLTWGRI